MAKKYVTLQAQPRDLTGKQVKWLRDEGLTPIVVYGRKTDPVPLQTETKELVRVLNQAGGSNLIQIEVEGESSPRITLAKDLQRHVTRLTPLHADFMQVAMDEAITQEVPLVVLGEPEIIKNTEAILGVSLNRITLRCLPADLPPQVELDATRMEEVGDALYVSDVSLGDEIEIMTDPDLLVARIFIPTMEVEEPEEEEDEELEELELEGVEGEEIEGEAVEEAPEGEEEE